jgi:pilus assembly protein CpaE
LLESYLTAATGGLQLLAGATEPDANELLSTDFARLFDVLVGRFEYVIVDASSRLDRFAKLICELSDNVLLVAQPDVSSLWSASKLQDYIGDREQGKHVQLVVNRFRKIPGLSESDIERATRMPISYRIPNQYNIVASSIDRGLPLVEENHTEIARAVVNMASTLAGKPAEQKKKSFSFFGS